MALNSLFNSYWGLVSLLLATCLSRGEELDHCLKERNCTLQLNASTYLHCTVGSKKECDSFEISENPSGQSNPELYPLLATIAIYKRTYEDDFQLDAINFSFLLPHNDDGVSGIMAEFGEAPGHHHNKNYAQPVCRVFQFSNSIAALRQAQMTYGRIAVPYNCIGIGIVPSVFYLNLTSAPSSLGLNYVVSWHRRASSPYDQGYYYDDIYSRTHRRVWAEKLIAVVSIQQAKIIHAVFQPPTTDAGLRFLKVYLKKQLEVVQIKQVELNETSIIFTDVQAGEYHVVLSPQGDTCNLDPNICTDVTSEIVSVGQNSEDDHHIVLIGGCVCGSVAVLLLLMGIILLIRRKRELATKGILVTSLACRELEKHVTYYFCLFLSAVLDTDVIYTFPVLHPGQAKVINIHAINCKVETKESLLKQEYDTELSAMKNMCTYNIILQFSYPDNLHKIQSTAGKLCSVMNISCYSQGLCKETSFVLEDIIQDIPDKRVSFVTFSKECVPIQSSLAFTIFENSENGKASSDQVTVLNNAICHSSNVDGMSLCNRSDIPAHKSKHKNIKEYLLPGDVNQLYEHLRSQLHSKAKCLTCNELTKFEYWHLALTVYNKAADDQPNCIENDHFGDGTLSDVVTIDGGFSEPGYIPGRHLKLFIKPEQTCDLQSTSEHIFHLPDPLLSYCQNGAQYSDVPVGKVSRVFRAQLDSAISSNFIEDIEKRHIVQEDSKAHCETTFSASDGHHCYTDLACNLAPLDLNGTMISYDSYSNLTEAESDMKLLSDMCHVNAELNHYNALRREITQAQSQKQILKDTETTGPDCHFSVRSRTSDYESFDGQQMENIPLPLTA